MRTTTSTGTLRGRQRLVLAAVIAVVLVGGVSLGGFAVMEHDAQPEGGLFGLPTRVNVCGGLLERDPGQPVVLTMAQVRASLAEVDATLGRSEPLVVVEPTIGQMPLLAPFGIGVPCGGLVAYLHTGPDAYVEYAGRP